jgi:hypothetical protein
LRLSRLPCQVPDCHDNALEQNTGVLGRGRVIDGAD